MSQEEFRHTKACPHDMLTFPYSNISDLLPAGSNTSLADDAGSQIIETVTVKTVLEGALSTTGLVAGVLAIARLTTGRAKTGSVRYILAILCADISVLLLMFLPWLQKLTNIAWRRSDAGCVAQVYVTGVATTASHMFICAFSIARYRAVRHPFTSRVSGHNVRRTRIYLVLIFLFAALANLGYVLTMESRGFGCWLRPSYAVFLQRFTNFVFFVNTAFPVVLLSILNVCICCVLLRDKSPMSNLRTTQYHARRRAAAKLVLSFVVYTLLNLPAGIVHVLQMAERNSIQGVILWVFYFLYAQQYTVHILVYGGVMHSGLTAFRSVTSRLSVSNQAPAVRRWRRSKQLNFLAVPSSFSRASGSSAASHQRCLSVQLEVTRRDGVDGTGRSPMPRRLTFHPSLVVGVSEVMDESVYFPGFE